MSEQAPQPPFRSLGSRLKTIRQKLQESVADVSGAIEIDEERLQRIEQGQERPSEDILMLLISHFGMHEDEAANLWLLAGYDEPQSGRDRDDNDGLGRPTIMLMGIDPRVVYSDSVHIAVNPSGVVMSFSQSGPGSQPLAIARVGMSRDQARNVLKIMGEALHQFDNPPVPKSLPQRITRNQDKKSDQ